MMNEEDKRLAAESAASLVEGGMVIGLGTGSTAIYAINAIGRRIEEEDLDILVVPTSFRSEIAAIESNIPLTSLSEHTVLDLTIDGADQVAGLNAIKGGWGSHTREKIVASASKRLIICVDGGKVVDVLDRPIPLEVIPYAWKIVEEQIKEIDGIPRIRMEGWNVFTTESGNIIIDADFGEILDPEDMDKRLSSIVGAIEHGIFRDVSEVHVGKNGTVFVIES
jgi:ribose 5-phosphate isomerase A